MAAGTTGPDELRFLWWNAQDFAHYRRDRSDRSDWPPSRRAYDEKRRRVGAVLAAGKQHLGGLELIGLCEVTRRAAERLRDEFLAGYDVVDGGGDESSFRVAWLVAPGSRFRNGRRSSRRTCHGTLVPCPSSTCSCAEAASGSWRATGLRSTSRDGTGSAWRTTSFTNCMTFW